MRPMPDAVPRRLPQAVPRAVPDGLPVLGAGRHRSPARGACFMEYASVLGGERWSDDPKVTHPVLATLARHVNDLSSDAGRQRLVLLVPSVLTGHRRDPALAHRLVRRTVLQAVPVAVGARRRTLYVALLAADAACGPADCADRRAVAVLLADPDDDLRAAIRFRRRHARRTSYDDRAVSAAVQLAVRTLADSGGVRADALLHDLLADAIALVRGEERPAQRARIPAQRTAWTRAAGSGRAVGARG